MNAPPPIPNDPRLLSSDGGGESGGGRMRPIDCDDPRLTQALQQKGGWLASLDEYAAATGLTVEEILSQLGPHLDDGTLALEPSPDHRALFLHTAASGRPAASLVDVPENLWERLRRHADVAGAYALWQLIRNLELAGWVVETRVSHILQGMTDRLVELPRLGVRVKGAVHPVLPYPSAEALAADQGLLTAYERAQARRLGVVCSHGALDMVATAYNAWRLARPYQAQLEVFVLEEPRFNPTLLTAKDGAITPKVVNRDELGPVWQPPQRPSERG